MNRYSVYIHKSGSGLCATVDADDEAGARAEAEARWNEVNPFVSPEGGLFDISLLGPAPARAPFVAFARFEMRV